MIEEEEEEEKELRGEGEEEKKKRRRRRRIFFKRCIFDALLFNPVCAKVLVHKSASSRSFFSIGNEQSRTIHESGVLPVQACRRPQSFLRKLQRLSRRTGVNAHSTRPQAKCRSCCPYVAEQCCPRAPKISVLRAVCGRH